MPWGPVGFWFCKVWFFYFHLFSGVWAALVQTCGQENCRRDGQKRWFGEEIFALFNTSQIAVGQNGCFLVRDSRHGGADSPLTLTLFNNDKVFNISIRLRADGKVAVLVLSNSVSHERVLIVWLMFLMVPESRRLFLIRNYFRWLSARRSLMSLVTNQSWQWSLTIRWSSWKYKCDISFDHVRYYWH